MVDVHRAVGRWGIAGAEDQVVLHVLVQLWLSVAFMLISVRTPNPGWPGRHGVSGHRIVGERDFSDVEMAMLMVFSPHTARHGFLFTNCARRPPDGSPQAVLYRIFTRTAGTPYPGARRLEADQM